MLFLILIRRCRFLGRCIELINRKLCAPSNENWFFIRVQAHFRKDFSMSMGMSMGFSQSLRPEQTLSQQLTQEQQQKLEVRITAVVAHVAIRIQILQALHPGGRFQPNGNCPSCGHEMSVEEILRGFSPDPRDTLTRCPKCKKRFQPQMVSRDSVSTTSIPFYCENQTVEKLRRLGHLAFEQLLKEYPAVVTSARFYWGGVTKGFSLAGIVYKGEPKPTWRDKVKNFLGKCPDSVIAEVVGVSETSVRRFRKSEGVKSFTELQKAAASVS